MFKNRAVLKSIVVLALLQTVGCNSAATSSMTQISARTRPLSSERLACQPDFSLNLTPSHAIITSNQSVRVTVKLTSVCGLSGSINVGVHSVSPPTQQNDGLSIYEPRYDIPLDANSTAADYITFGATPNTLKTTYTITIQGKVVSGDCCHGRTHSAIFTLTVK